MFPGADLAQTREHLSRASPLPDAPRVTPVEPHHLMCYPHDPLTSLTELMQPLVLLILRESIGIREPFGDGMPEPLRIAQFLLRELPGVSPDPLRVHLVVQDQREQELVRAFHIRRLAAQFGQPRPLQPTGMTDQQLRDAPIPSIHSVPLFTAAFGCIHSRSSLSRNLVGCQFNRSPTSACCWTPGRLSLRHHAPVLGRRHDAARRARWSPSCGLRLEFTHPGRLVQHPRTLNNHAQIRKTAIPASLCTASPNGSCVLLPICPHSSPIVRQMPHR